MDTNNFQNTTEIKVFVASSLSFREERRAIKDTVEKAIEKEVPEALSCQGTYSFHAYVYEDDGPQRLEHRRAQNPINEEIRQSTFFFLIIDSVVGEKTVEEFKVAYDGFKKHQNPAYISIFVRQGDVKPDPEKKQMSFEQFKQEYLTNFYWHADNNTMVKDVALYEFPFTTTDDIKDKVFKSIMQWMELPNRPLVGVKQGQDFTPVDFYGNDTERTRRYDDNKYFKRGFDDDLIKALYWENTENKIVFLSGPSLSGKTRAMLRAMHHEDMRYKWFHRVPSYNTVKRGDILRLANYVNTSKSDQMLYIVFDDFDKYNLDDDDELSDGIGRAIRKLFAAVKDSNFVKILIVSSLSSSRLAVSELFDESNTTVKKIQIKDLNDKERLEAIMYFTRVGFAVSSGDTSSVGALLINLDEKKRIYQSFLNTTRNDKVRIFRESLLRAIKAFSIWHRTNIGDLDSLFDFCSFLVSRRETEDGEIELTREVFDKMIMRATNSGDATLPGLSISDDRKTLEIQEYVYRYFIDFKGEADSARVANDVDDEMQLIYEIMAYVACKGKGMMIDFAKLICRCEHSNKVTKRMMALFNGEGDNDVKGDKVWLKTLLEERRVLEEGEINDATREMSFYYPKIFRQAIYQAETFADATQIYIDARDHLHDHLLFSALVVKANSADEVADLKKMADYQRFGTSPLVLYKMMQKVQTFAEAEIIMHEIIRHQHTDSAMTQRHGSLSLKGVETLYLKAEAEAVKGNRLEGELFDVRFNGTYLALGLSRIFSLVTDEEELERALDLIKDNYLYIASIGEKQMTQDNLPQPTIIEMLGNLKMGAVFNAFSNLYAGNFGQMGDFITNKLIPAISATLSHNEDAERQGYTIFPKHKVITTIAVVGNAFISQFKTEGFKDAYENVFKKMEDEKHGLILRDPYTYTLLFRLRDCSLDDAVEVYRDYIKPHADSKTSPLVVNSFILNDILKKAKKDNVSLLNDIDEMFDVHGVERDQYTYNMMIKAKSYDKALAYIDSSVGSKRMKPDPYTFGHLIEAAPDLHTALAYLDRSKITLPDGYKVLPVSGKYISKEVNENRDAITHWEITWIGIFKKECRYAADRHAMRACLDYLKSDESCWLMLSSGAVFNVCLSNGTFIRNSREAFAFIDDCEAFAAQHGRTFFDSYTLAHALYILKGENTHDRHGEVICKANELFHRAMRHGVDIASIAYNSRLSLFHSQEEKAGFVFFRQAEEGGSMEPYTKECTPVEYVEEMVKCGVKIDMYTLITCARFFKAMTDETLEKLMALCSDVKLDLGAFYEMVRQKNIEKDSPVYNLLKDVAIAHTSPDEYNRAIIKRYINEEITYEEAIQQLDVSSVATVTYSLNMLLFNYKEKNRRNERCAGSVFQGGWKLYTQFMAPQGGETEPKAKPSSFTFSVLASMRAGVEDMKMIRDEMARLNRLGGYHLTESDYFLSADIQVSQSVAEIKAYEQRFLETHPATSRTNTDKTFYRIVMLANAANKAEATEQERAAGLQANEYAARIVRYLFTRDVADKAVFEEPDTPVSLHIYCESPLNVSAETIINILKWHNLIWIGGWEKDFVQALFTHYPHTIDQKGQIARYIVEKSHLLERILPELDTITDSQHLREFRYTLVRESLKQQSAATPARADEEFERVKLCGKDKNALRLLTAIVARHLNTYPMLEKVVNKAASHRLDIDDETASALALAVANNFHKDPRLLTVLKQIEGELEDRNLQLGHFVVAHGKNKGGYSCQVGLDDNVRELVSINRDLHHSDDFSGLVGQLAAFCRERADRARRKDRSKTYNIAPVAARAVVAWMAKMANQESKSEKTMRQQCRANVQEVFNAEAQGERLDLLGLLDLVGGDKVTAPLHHLSDSGQVNFSTNRKIYHIGILAVAQDIPASEKYEIAHRLGMLPDLLRAIGSCQALLKDIDALPGYGIEEAILIALDTAASSRDYASILSVVGSHTQHVNEEIADEIIYKGLQFAVESKEFYESDFAPWVADNFNRHLALDAVAATFGVELHTEAVLTVSDNQFHFVKRFLAERRLYDALGKAAGRQEAYAAVARHLERKGKITHPFVALRLLTFNDVRWKFVKEIVESTWFDARNLAVDDKGRNQYTFWLTTPIFDSLLEYLKDKKAWTKIMPLLANSLAIAGDKILTPQNISGIICTIQDPETYEAFIATVCSCKLSLAAEHYAQLIDRLRYMRFSKRFLPASATLKEVWSRVTTHADIGRLQQGHFCYCEFSRIKFDWWASADVEYQLPPQEAQRPLEDKICKNMFNLPERYVKALMLLEKYNLRKPLSDEVGEKMKQYSQEFLATLDERYENFWTLRRVAYLWYKTGEWDRIKSLKHAERAWMMKRIISFINKIANGSIVSSPYAHDTAAKAIQLIHNAIDAATRGGYDSVRLSLRNISNRIPLKKQAGAQRDKKMDEELQRISFRLNMDEIMAVLDE